LRCVFQKSPDGPVRGRFTFRVRKWRPKSGSGDLAVPVFALGVKWAVRAQTLLFARAEGRAGWPKPPWRGLHRSVGPKRAENGPSGRSGLDKSSEAVRWTRRAKTGITVTEGPKGPVPGAEGPKRAPSEGPAVDKPRRNGAEGARAPLAQEGARESTIWTFPKFSLASPFSRCEWPIRENFCL